jgi:hypothetical protein
VAEVEDYTGRQGNGNDRLWEPLPSNGTKDVTVDTSENVIVIRKMWPLTVTKCSISGATNPNAVCSHYMRNRGGLSLQRTGRAPCRRRKRYVTLVDLAL